MSLLARLRQRSVRNLYWACFSQPLLSFGRAAASFETVAAAFPHVEAWFLALDRQPTSLHDHLNRLPSHRLGDYFEGLWAYYLRFAGVADLVAKNLQVRAGGQTLGEYDFIYYCYRRQCHVHMEAALKFYLAAPSSMDGAAACAQRASWVGPACRDRLDLKYDALERQLQLSATAAGSQLLALRGVSIAEIESACKGYLFYRHTDGSCAAPQGACPAHPRGVWLHHSQLSAISNRYPAWQVLTRREWLAPMRLSPSTALLSEQQLSTALAHHFAQPSAEPLQVAAMEQCAADWLERQRYFVMPDGWNGRLPIPV